MKQQHGGDIYTYKGFTDFSSNCNPFGTSQHLKNKISEIIDEVGAYPPIGYRPLREAIGKKYKLNPHNIILGNGACELFFSITLGLKPKKALILAPTFIEYERALEASNSEIQYYYLDHSYELDNDYLNIIDKFNIIFLCNPNNPTGKIIKKNLLLKILNKAKKSGTIVIVDQCFLDFTDYESELSLIPYINEFKNLIIVQSFTKRYAIPGVRLGYLITANNDYIKSINKVIQPWNLSLFAYYLGLTALSMEDNFNQTKEYIKNQREFLTKALNSKGYKTYSSYANYIFFKGDEKLFKKLLEKKVLIRDCSNYKGLKTGYYRIAVKTKEENLVLVKALDEIKE